MSWQDYEREYEAQCRGENKKVLSQTVIKMENIVNKFNDEILELANNNIKVLDLNQWLSDKETKLCQELNKLHNIR